MKRFTKLFLCLLLGFCLLSSYLPMQAFAESPITYDAANYPVFQRSPQEIANRWRQASQVGPSYVNGQSASYYSHPASTVAPYHQGEVTQDTLDVMGAMINYLRWLSGAEPLQQGLSKNDALQRAALIRNFDFAHSVNDAYKPADMSQALWDSGKDVWHNILAYNYTPRSAIFGWCNEGYNLDEDQWDTLGHRFCLLRQDISVINLAYSGKVAIGVMEQYNNTVQVPFTAYPAPGAMPLDHLYAKESAWSLQPDPSLFEVRDVAQLEARVTNVSTGASYSCTIANKKLQYHGVQGGSIGFVQPDCDSNRYADGSVYQVCLTGLQERATGRAAILRYQVEFFSLEDYPEQSYSVNLEVGAGGTATLSADQATPGTAITVTVSPNMGYKLKQITWAAADKAPVDITGTRSFTMPETNVTVCVRFEPAPLHPLTLQSGPNGTASLSHSTASVGQKITVTPQPQPNYETASITWTTPGNDPVDITKTKSFLMPDAAVTVHISFKLHNPFADVKESDFFFQPVMWAVINGITNGRSETSFAPNEKVKRSEAMTFFWRAKGSPAPITTTSPFKDVKKKDWYYTPVLWAVEHEITEGTSPTKFSPNKKCVRSEILKFLYSAVGRPEHSGVNPYSDVKQKHWYYDSAIWAYEKGIEKGSDGKFKPKTACTRAYVVTYLYRFLTGNDLVP